MAHLLGSQNCVESLSKDVTAMQEGIQTILAKTGHLEHASWKYPSKAASSLDIDELVEDYAYCADDPESNRLSHIVLFELIIDRFCLLLQCVGELFTSMCNVSTGVVTEMESSRPPSRTVTTTMSVGLVTKLFLHKMADVERYVEAVDKEVREYNQSLMKMEDVLLELTVENEKLKRNPLTTKRTSAKLRKNKVEGMEDDNSTNEINEVTCNNTTDESTRTNTVFTQTYETAFVPCEACSAMQANVIKVGTSVIDICEAHGLPCSLAKQKKLMKNTQMTANDVGRWCTEEERDIAKVSKYLREIHDQLGPLQTELSQVQVSNKTLTDQLNTASETRDELKSRVETAEQECTRQRTKIGDLEKKLCITDENNAQLGEENVTLKGTCAQLTEDVNRYKQSTQVLEDGMKNLSTQLETHKSANENLRKIEDELSNTRLKLENTEAKLKLSLEECNKVKADKKVILEHDQGLQLKQTNLLSRIDKLDETCKDLVTQLGENEEEIENVTQENTKLSEEIKQLKEERSVHLRRIQQLERDLKNIPTSENLNHAKTSNSNKVETKDREETGWLSEQLRLVVCYPVIGKDYKEIEDHYMTTVDNNRYNNNNDTDVLKDLENQIAANSARIGVLDEQNYKLRNSLLKLEEANLDSTETLLDDSGIKQSAHKPANMACTPISKEILEPRPPSEPRTSNKLSRPRSANRNEKNQPALDIGAKLANLDRLKNSSLVEKFDWTPMTSIGDMTSPPQQAWQESKGGGSQDSDMTSGSIICADCDKTYLSTRDLDIHKNFCYGKIAK